MDFRPISDDSDGSDDEVGENSHTELDDERAADMPDEAPAENVGDLPDEETDALDNAEQDVPAAAELPRKQKFCNLDAVCDESKYDALPPQKKRHTYKNAKGAIVMNYDTEKPEDRPSRRGANNILHNRPGPRGAAKRVKTPLDAFALFVGDWMIEKVIEYTNRVIQPFLDQYEAIISKYSFYKLVDP